MATYTDNGTNTPNGSHKVFTYTFPALQTEDIKVALNGVAQATTKYTASLSPAQIEFNNTSIDSSVQESTGAPKTGVQVRVFRETTVGKNSGDEDPKAVFAAGSSIRAADLNANQEQALFAIHELQTQPIKTSDIEPDAVTNAKIVDNAIDSEHYVDGSIDRVHLEADIIDGSKIEDNAVDNEHIAANAVRTSEIQNSAVIQDKLANNSVGTPELINGSVNSDKILDGTIVNADISSSAAIDASKIVSATGSVAGTMSAADKAKLDGIESGAKDDQTAAEIKTLLQSNKITDSEIATGTLDNRYFTETELTSGALDGRYFTETESDARYFNVSTGDTIKDGDTFPDNDTTIATTAAINDRIIDLVDDVGGFVPIANETSFPTSNPDVNNGAGTIVSVSAASTNLVPSGTTVTIANGRGSGLPVVITGVSATIPSGFGFLVETTTTDHTYAFHRLSPKATEVTTVAGKATEIGRLGTADAVADMAILGTADVVADLNTLGTADVVADMNMLATSDVISDMNTLAVTDVINDMDTVATNVTNVNTVGGSISNVNTTAGSISNVNTVAGAISNVNSVAGSISNVNTTAGSISNVNSVASNMANVNNFNDKYQIAANNPSTDGGGNALAAGDLYFNTSANELKVYNGSAWQGGVTASGSFATTTGNTFTGDNRYNDGVKALFGTGSDLEIFHSGSASIIQNSNVDNLTLRQQYSNGYLFLHADNAHIRSQTNNEQFFEGVYNGAASLFYDNSKKFETTSTGVSVTGGITADGTSEFTANVKFDGGTAGRDITFLRSSNTLRFQDNTILSLGDSDDLKMFHNGTIARFVHQVAGSNIEFQSDNYVFRDKDNSDLMIRVLHDGAAELYYDNSKKIETTSTGVSVAGNGVFTGNIQVNDNNFLYIGNSGDLSFKHDGSNSYILNSVGHLYIQNDGSSTTEKIILQAKGGYQSLIAVPEGGVELYYNNNKKLETDNSGVTITGRLETTSNVKAKQDGIGFRSGADDDLQIYHDGTDSHIQNTQNSGELKIRSHQTDIKNADNNETQAIFHENGKVELYYDNSKKFETYSSGAYVFGHLYTDDNNQHRFGNDGDLQIYHDGSNSYIKHSGGGNLRIETTGDANEDIYLDAYDDIYLQVADGADAVKCIGGGSVEIYHNNGKKFASHSNGLAIKNEAGGSSTSLYVIGPEGESAEIQMNADDGDDNSDYYRLIHMASDNSWRLQNYHAGSWGDNIRVLDGAGVKLYYDNSQKFETTNGGVVTTGYVSIQGGSNGQLYVEDNGKINLGTSQDLQLYHNGTDSLVNNYTGNLYIQSANNLDLQNTSGEKYIKAIEDGAVELYYDNSKKFQTASHGITAFGDVFFDNQVNSGKDLYWDESADRLSFSDNVHAAFGNGEDLRIYHDGSNNYIKGTGNHVIYVATNNVNRWRWLNDGHFGPEANNTYDLGSSSQRIRNIYTNDLNLSNEGSSNDVDGTWGNWTIQEGESDLFLKNNRSGKKYKFNLTEVS